jgi:hypothetical protein
MAQFPLNRVGLLFVHGNDADLVWVFVRVGQGVLGKPQKDGDSGLGFGLINQSFVARGVGNILDARGAYPVHRLQARESMGPISDGDVSLQG